MAINFPGSLDNFTNPTSASPINSPSHADQHANANDAIEALEAKVGANNSTITTSHDYKIAQLESLVTSSVAGAKSIYQDVRNQSGSEFVKGTPVYVSGSEGASGKMLISAASNASEATSSKTMGITTSAISNNSNGQVISEGIIEGIDTTGAADGDPVWLGVNGAKIYGLVSKPSAPAHLVFLGIVIRGGQANTGSMYVKIQNGFELQEIHNVELSSLVNGNVLAYDSSTSTWKNTNTLQSTSSTVPLVIKRVTSQTSNLQEWQDQSGGMLAFFNKDGALTFNSSSAIGGTLNVFTSYAGNTGVIIRGFTSQTAALTQWQSSSANILAQVDAYGSASFGGNNTLGSSLGIGVGGNASQKGITVKGAASQTANLQEWQDSAGTVLVSIGSNGFGLFGANVQVNGDLRAGASNLARITSISDSTTKIGLVVRGAASQTANLQEWQNSAGTVLATVNASGEVRAPLFGSKSTGKALLYTAASATGEFRIDTNVATNKGLVIRGAGSQTANLQEWQDSAGTVLANIWASGTFATAGRIAVGNGSTGAKLDIMPASTTQVGVTIKANASQTANLQEWQSDTGTVLSKVTSSGRMDVSGLTVIGNAYASGVVLALFVGTGTSQVPLASRGSSTQTANLQEWQNSSGTVLTSVNKDGHLHTPRLVIANGGNIVDSAGTTPYFGFGSNQIAIYTRNAAYKGLVIQGSASQTADLQQWQTSAGQTNLSVNFGGALQSYIQMTADNTNSGITSFIAKTAYANVKPMIVQGAASQTANLQEWQNSDGTVLASIYPTGFINTASGIGAGTTSYMNGIDDLTATKMSLRFNSTSYGLQLTNIQPAAVGYIVKAAASQTANLQEWQNSAGTVLARVSSGGAFVTSAVGVFGAQSNTPNAQLYVLANSITLPTFVAKATASQTGNLTEWQDSTGTVLSYITASGALRVNSAFGGTQAAITAGSAATVGLIVRGAASQTANLQEWQDSAGGIRSRINSNGDYVFNNSTLSTNYGQLFLRGATDYGAAANINTGYLGTVGLTIRGQASQTANLQEWQNSAGTVLVKIAADGTTTFAGGYTSINQYGEILTTGSRPLGIGGTLFTNTVVSIQPTLASLVGIAVRGAASQTANLQEWQNSAGTVLVKIAADGRVTFPGANANVHASGNLTVRGSDAWSANASALIGTGYAGGIGLIVKAVDSQTANLQEWQDSSGTVKAYIGANGFINTNNSLRVAGDNISAYRFQGVSDGNYTMNFPGSGNIQLFSATNDTGSGVGVLGIKNATTAPTSNPTTGGILYVSSGALLYRGIGGAITTLARSGNESSTISVNTATTVDTVALSSFTTIEYTLSIKQGSKIRSSKVLVHTDGTSVDSTEYGIMEMGGGITGILVTASVSSTNAILQVTITDAATTNATVKLIKTML